MVAVLYISSDDEGGKPGAWRAAAATTRKKASPAPASKPPPTKPTATRIRRESDDRYRARHPEAAVLMSPVFVGVAGYGLVWP